MLKIVQGCRDSRLDSQVTRDCQAAKVGTRMEHAGELKSHANCCTTGQKSQAGQAVSLRLELATQPSREVKSPDHPILEKLTFHIPFSPYYIQTLIPTKCRELLERFLRKKPQRKIRLIHPQSSNRDSLNSSTLFLSIVKSLRGTLPKPFLTIPISVRRPFGVWEAVKKGPIHIGRCYSQVAEFGKLKKKQVRRNLVGVGAWRVQVHWLDQAWRVFYCSCIPTTFFSGLFTA